MLQALVRPISAVVSTVTDVGLEDAATVVAAEVVGSALNRPARWGLIRQVVAVRGTWTIGYMPDNVADISSSPNILFSVNEKEICIY